MCGCCHWLCMYFAGCIKSDSTPQLSLAASLPQWSIVVLQRWPKKLFPIGHHYKRHVCSHGSLLLLVLRIFNTWRFYRYININQHSQSLKKKLLYVWHLPVLTIHPWLLVTKSNLNLNLNFDLMVALDKRLSPNVMRLIACMKILRYFGLDEGDGSTGRLIRTTSEAKKRENTWRPHQSTTLFSTGDPGATVGPRTST